jgi:hypothetical protein
MIEKNVLARKVWYVIWDVRCGKKETSLRRVAYMSLKTFI